VHCVAHMPKQLTQIGATRHGRHLIAFLECREVHFTNNNKTEGDTSCNQ
jgi:hypothetical protein